MCAYFSDREMGERPRSSEEIEQAGWHGIYALIKSRIEDGSFGREYPLKCSDDGQSVCGTNQSHFQMAILAEIPEADFRDARDTTPSTPAILDMLEFSHAHIALPIQGKHHAFMGHHHLTFDVAAGQARFRQDVNRLFARQGLVYEMNDDGRVVRRAPEGVEVLLGQSPFRTGDASLDQLLEEARKKYRDPDFAERKIALEKLWDAFERIKTLEDGDKRTGIGMLLDRVAEGPASRAMLEAESTALTAIGNSFRIRHHESTKAELSHSDFVDHLFHRMLAFIWLLLRRSGRLQ